MDPRLFTIEHLDDLLFSGSAWIWFSGKSAVVVEIKTFPTGARAVAVLVAAGDRHEIANDLRPHIEAWGAEQGCQFAIVESRGGWVRALKSAGYAPFQNSILKEL